jgi:hypothetical protein
MKFVIFDVYMVNQNLSFADFVKPVEQIDNGRFSCSCGTHQGDDFSG